MAITDTVFSHANVRTLESNTISIWSVRSLYILQYILLVGVCRNVRVINQVGTTRATAIGPRNRTPTLAPKMLTRHMTTAGREAACPPGAFSLSHTDYQWYGFSAPIYRLINAASAKWLKNEWLGRWFSWWFIWRAWEFLSWNFSSFSWLEFRIISRIFCDYVKSTINQFLSSMQSNKLFKFPPFNVLYSFKGCYDCNSKVVNRVPNVLRI